jgi:hypothetical protein
MFVERISTAAMAGTLVLVGAGLVAGAEPTPTPTPRPAGGQSLTDVAKDKKLKGDSKEGSGGQIVITNENLADYASKGGLTTAKPGAGQTSGRAIHTGPSVSVLDPKAAAATERMQYWQQRYMQQLERIATLKRMIADLDYEIPGMWRDFYAWDDPAYRDGVIKPKLDAALKRRDSLEEQLRQEEPKLDQIKESARKEGAEPGWFRGLQEPTPVPARPTPERVIY